MLKDEDEIELKLKDRSLWVQYVRKVTLGGETGSTRRFPRP